MKYIGIIILVSSTIIACGQSKLKYDVIFGHTQISILYREFPNQIVISVPGIKQEGLYVTYQTDKIIGNNGVYTITPDKYRGHMRIKVYHINENDTILLGTQKYKTINLPKPYAVFMGKTSKDTTMIKGRLVAGAGIIAKVDDLPMNIKYIVDSFMVEITTKTGTDTFSSSNNRITEEMTNKFKELNPKDKVIFKEIHASLKDVRFNLEQLNFEIL